MPIVVVLCCIVLCCIVLCCVLEPEGPGVECPHFTQDNTGVEGLGRF